MLLDGTDVLLLLLIFDLWACLLFIMMAGNLAATYA